MSESRASQSDINIDEVREAIKKEYGDPADGQDYIDRSAIDFDPADGLYTGTAVEGNSEIAGPHESQEPVDMDDEITENLEQRAADDEEGSTQADRDAAGAEAMSRRESADEAAGEEIDRNL